MRFSVLNATQAAMIQSFFTQVFAQAEGEDEGALVGALAGELARTMDDEVIVCLGAWQGDKLLGAIFFSRLETHTASRLYLLAPVAVRTDCQDQGIGQALIREGLAVLTARGVQGVVTYGDPAFYHKVGFVPLDEQSLPAPYPLSMPQGWLGQSLSEQPLPSLARKPECVAAFCDPSYW